mgnify:FL=1
MRIISGCLKGRIIQAPSHFKLRPTTDLAKEGLFNILANQYDFDDVKVLDLFAGIGSFSFECASRGCQHITSVEKNRAHALFIKQQSEKLQTPQIQVVISDMRNYIKTCKQHFDIIFADPPYDLPWLETIPTLLYESSCVNSESLIIIEHSKNISFCEHPHFIQMRKYGKVHFSLFLKHI